MSNLVLQDVWREAVMRPQGVKIPCPTKELATKLRFDLYNAVRKYRTGSAVPDSVLAKAMEECSITLEDGGQIVFIGRKTSSGMMPEILALLGKVEGELKSPETLAAEESSSRVMERLEALTAAAPVPVSKEAPNPYGLRYPKVQGE